MTDSQLEQIALNAIRWRSKGDIDSKGMAQGDRRWLLRYIDRLEAQLASALTPDHLRTLHDYLDSIDPPKP
jgi:hypothetical protein